MLRISVHANLINFMQKTSDKEAPKMVRDLKTTGKIAVVEKEMKKIELLILCSEKPTLEYERRIHLGRMKLQFFVKKGSHTSVATVANGRYRNLVLDITAIITINRI